METRNHHFCIEKHQVRQKLIGGHHLKPGHKNPNLGGVPMPRFPGISGQRRALNFSTKASFRSSRRFKSINLALGHWDGRGGDAPLGTIFWVEKCRGTRWQTYQNYGT